MAKEEISYDRYWELTLKPQEDLTLEETQEMCIGERKTVTYKEMTAILESVLGQFSLQLENLILVQDLKILLLKDAISSVLSGMDVVELNNKFAELAKLEENINE